MSRIACAGIRDRDGGYASLDALAALVILTTSLMLSFVAVTTAGRLASRALELSRANARLAYLVETIPLRPGEYSGGQGAPWRVVVRAPEPGAHLCRVEAEVPSTSGHAPLTLTAAKPCQVGAS